MKIKFTVYGKPVPQGRPRFARVGNFVKTYDPKTSGSWKDTIRIQALNEGKQILSLRDALAIKLVFWLPRPKSLPKKIRYPAKKPDLDNYIKAVEDALEGICYGNDSQVVQIEALKAYLVPGSTSLPRVEIEITELEH